MQYLYNVRSLLGLWRWALRGFSLPVPPSVKRSFLIQRGLPNAVWIETGTYKGGTTEILASFSIKVFSIEPNPVFFQRAKNRLATRKNVEIINAYSEDVIRTLLISVFGNVNFWLDGHYSGGSTYKGATNTPIIAELSAIAENLNRLSNVRIFIDDVDCFFGQSSKSEGYPQLEYLTQWSTSNGFEWGIENNIFFMYRNKNF